ncbi:DUF167 family protein YggU [Shewanella glacialipiscicola]|uniref:UPF0235 protein GCM10025855_07960 n=1 Tax=Shewanella glacialipiscicola TaxID=614069 RepID=A0ABQ6IZH2_9GAMM|nr:DUF167 family protein YggU [Shewanella glacialipiscicola]MCL1086534.1 DUF167 family protein YggU [Shewanella glacialipiscicola]MCU7993998.1 DUF167 family protein YggU [Shewanella glacialipiscicola]MCU8025316.1 DUF167 family protein YggU [Shewanella glacialipiscicola]GIU10665.1 UPF0235 protein [Shewanella glacialipiscicola]GMA81263.1 UPF0235 protein [Shewanella glacialipiscicola]
MCAVTLQQGDLLLNLYIQPKASRDQIVGLHGNELKVAITAPPIDGKANAHLSKYLAKAFKVPKSNIHIVKGELGRHKQIRVIDPKLIPSVITELMSNSN